MKNLLNLALALVFACLVCFPALDCFAVSGAPLAGELDSAFKPVIDSAPGSVRVAVVQPDGKTIVGGSFKTLNNLARRNIARLTADNSVDTTFSADIRGTVYALAVQADGKILVGGDFTAVGGVSRNRIARLNADGSLDTTFNPGNGADKTVYAIAVQPDGKILLGGGFFGVNSTADYLVARLNADGSIDATFKSPFAPSPFGSSNAPPSVVNSLAVQSNGKIVLGGTSFTSSSGNTTFIITAITRLNADGAIDSTFKAPSINGAVEKVLIQPDDKILISGSFTSVNGVSRRFVARLNDDGSLDASFNPGTGGDSPVHSIFLKADGKILIAGSFFTFNETQRRGIAQLNADGSLDTAFAPSSGSFATFQSVVALPNGKILAVGSSFGSFNIGGDSITVFNPDGSRDAGAVFTTTALGGVRAVATQANGKIIVGGNFNRAGGLSRNNTARFNADGSLISEAGDDGFSSFSGSGGQVNSIVVQPDGKILIAGLNLAKRISNGGGFGIIGGFVITRQNADGTNDDSFVSGYIPTRQGVNEIALQPDGKIVVVWGYEQPNGFPSGGAARLNADGSIDSTFTYTLPELFLNSVVVQPDGKILLGGVFGLGFGGRSGEISSYNGVIRLNADGSRDTTFAPATISDSTRFTRVYALALQPDGKILVGGNLSVGTATTPTGVARLNPNGSLDASFNANVISGASADNVRVETILPLPNGQIVIGGLFDNIGTAARKNIARLNANGALDNSFNAAADNTVYALALQTDGKILIGGDFETVNGAPRTSLARLLSDAPTAARRVSFDYDGDGRADISLFRLTDRVWYIANSSNSTVSYTQFGLATDKIVPADYDGDGKTDIAVFRPETGVWFIMKSSGGTQFTQFGTAEDIPQPADYNGDGKAEIAVFRPSTGVWFILSSDTTSSTATQFGSAEDKPVAADYDGDGKSEIAVYRPSSGVWFFYNSTTRQTNATRFGIGSDKPVAADYDGDGKTDIAVYRPNEGNWYLLQSTSGYTVTRFGLSSDLPVAADYDGDGRADIAVYRPSEGNWYQLKSRDGFSIIKFGIDVDKPAPNAFIR